MSILSITTDFAGETGVRPRIVRVQSTDSFATVTTQNYLKPAIQSFGFTFYPDDIVAVSYGTNTSQFFTLNISSGNITLVPDSGNVTLPVTDNDFVNFSGTTGKLKDSGYSPTNAAKTKVVMLNAAPTANNLAKFSAADGTVGDAGARIISGTTTTYAGGGTSNAFTVTGLSATCVGSCVIRTSTNAVSIANAVPSANTLTVTFSADPGAGTTVDYIYTTAAQT